jgi:hypothetical protein
VSVGGLLALGYGLGNKVKKKEEKRRSVNCVEDAWIEIGSKWLKNKKIRSEARESYLLKEKIEDDRSTRKMDHGKLSNQKKMSTSALDHLAGKKERQASGARKMWVKEDLGL